MNIVFRWYLFNYLKWRSICSSIWIKLEYSPRNNLLFGKKKNCVTTQWLIGCVFGCLIISECTKSSLMLISPILPVFTCFDVQALCSAIVDPGEHYPATASTDCYGKILKWKLIFCMDLCRWSSWRIILLMRGKAKENQPLHYC